MDRCPICRGRINENEECKRCGAALSLLIQIEQQVNELTSQALWHIGNSQFTQAKLLLEEAQLLRHSPFQQVLGFIHNCMRGNPDNLATSSVTQ